jgi:uncharacterized membrane protein
LESVKGSPSLKLAKGVRAPVITMTLTASTTALVLVVTFFASINLPAASGQVFDAGDIVIFITAMTFGPVVGGIAGGIGSGLSDALHGYTTFAPFTLVIKGLEGLVAGYLVGHRFQGREYVAWFLASAIMVGGYFFSEAYLMGFIYGSGPGLANAILEFPFNVLQVSLGGNIGIPVSRYLRKSLPPLIMPLNPLARRSSN